MNSSLSSRGTKAANTLLRVDWHIFSEATKNLYHKSNNPNGAFTLNVAENRLSWWLMKEKIEDVIRNNTIPEWVPLYTSCLGAPSFRKVLSEFLSVFLTKCPVSPDHLALSAGATAVIEMTSWLLCEVGDVAVFPAPSYPVYKQDINNKSGVERYDLVTHSEISELKDQPILTIQHLEKTLAELQFQGKRFRMLVITTPDNPTGGVVDFETLSLIANWCINKHIHLIVNEIYGLSLINTSHPELKQDYASQPYFNSFANIMKTIKSEYLHLWYALSKDLGVSGFRVGILYTYNELLLQAYDNLNAPHLVSNLTQWVFELVLGDHVFMKNYIQKNQELLTESYLVVIRILRKLNIPYLPAKGSLFVWMDLSQYFSEQTQKAETVFWEKLYHETGVLLTPGVGFGHTKKGQFRLVFPCHTKAELEVAMERIGNYLNGD